MPKRILYLGLDPGNYKAIGEITHWPIIQIVARSLSDPSLHQALKNFDCYSHLLITSKSTVTILQNYLPSLGIELYTWAKKITLTVGQATAQHLIKTCGIHPLRIAQEETAEGLIEQLKQLPLKDAHVFWPHSSQARPIIKNFLTNHKIGHTTCILYDPKPVSPPKTFSSLEEFDEIVFTSPSTIEAFLSIFGQFPKEIQLTSIGPITANHLKNVKN